MNEMNISDYIQMKYNEFIENNARTPNVILIPHSLIKRFMDDIAFILRLNMNIIPDEIMGLRIILTQLENILVGYISEKDLDNIKESINGNND